MPRNVLATLVIVPHHSEQGWKEVDKWDFRMKPNIQWICNEFIWGFRRYSLNSFHERFLIFSVIISTSTSLVLSNMMSDRPVEWSIIPGWITIDYVILVFRDIVFSPDASKNKPWFPSIYFSRLNVQMLSSDRLSKYFRFSPRPGYRFLEQSRLLAWMGRSKHIHSALSRWRFIHLCAPFVGKSLSWNWCSKKAYQEKYKRRISPCEWNPPYIYIAWEMSWLS